MPDLVLKCVNQVDTSNCRNSILNLRALAKRMGKGGLSVIVLVGLLLLIRGTYFCVYSRI